MVSTPYFFVFRAAPGILRAGAAFGRRRPPASFANKRIQYSIFCPAGHGFERRAAKFGRLFPPPAGAHVAIAPFSARRGPSAAFWRMDFSPFCMDFLRFL